MDTGLIATLTAVAGLAAGVGALVGALVAWRKAGTAARKADLEAMEVVVDNLRVEYDRLIEENQDLKRRMVGLERELAEWEWRYARLSVWVRAQGLEPPENCVKGG